MTAFHVPALLLTCDKVAGAAVTGLAASHVASAAVVTVSGQGVYVLDADDRSQLLSWVVPASTQFSCPAVVDAASRRMIAGVRTAANSRSSKTPQDLVWSWTLDDTQGPEGASKLAISLPSSLCRLHSLDNAGGVVLVFSNGSVGCCDPNALDGLYVDDAAVKNATVIASEVVTTGAMNYLCLVTSIGVVDIRTVWTRDNEKPRIGFGARGTLTLPPPEKHAPVPTVVAACTIVDKWQRIAVC